MLSGCQGKRPARELRKCSGLEGIERLLSGKASPHGQKRDKKAR